MPPIKQMEHIEIKLQPRMNVVQGDIYYVYIDYKLILVKEFNNGRTNEQNIRRLFNKAIKLYNQ